MRKERTWDEETAARATQWLSDHGDFLFRYAKSRVLDVGSAEDLVQETLLAAMQHYGQFRGEASERTWLTGILRLKILEFWRRQALEKKTFSSESRFREEDAWFDDEGHWQADSKAAGMDWEPDPSRALEQKEFWSVLQHCLGKLPPKAAAVFAQRELEFLEAGEIQSQLNISESNLWVLLHRARGLLRRCLQVHWHGK